MSPVSLPSGFVLRRGSSLDRALLVKFTQRTYRELYPTAALNHLSRTVEQYFSNETPLWWVDPAPVTPTPANPVARSSPTTPIGCLWLGNAIDQIWGDRTAHIFLLYVAPDYRRQGIGSALMTRAEAWARARGDRQIGLQVFADNQPAIALYEKLGYRTHSLWMVKEVRGKDEG